MYIEVSLSNLCSSVAERPEDMQRSNINEMTISCLRTADASSHFENESELSVKKRIKTLKYDDVKGHKSEQAEKKLTSLNRSKEHIQRQLPEGKIMTRKCRVKGCAHLQGITSGDNFAARYITYLYNDPISASESQIYWKFDTKLQTVDGFNEMRKKWEIQRRFNRTSLKIECSRLNTK